MDSIKSHKEVDKLYEICRINSNLATIEIREEINKGRMNNTLNSEMSVGCKELVQTIWSNCSIKN
jgi:hypothetical protein